MGYYQVGILSNFTINFCVTCCRNVLLSLFILTILLLLFLTIWYNYKLKEKLQEQYRDSSPPPIHLSVCAAPMFHSFGILLMHFLHFWIIFLFSGIAKDSRFILVLACSVLEPTYFPRELWFLLVGIVFRSQAQGLGSANCYYGITISSPSWWTELGIIYNNICFDLFIYWKPQSNADISNTSSWAHPSFLHLDVCKFLLW